MNKYSWGCIFNNIGIPPDILNMVVIIPIPIYFNHVPLYFIYIYIRLMVSLQRFLGRAGFFGRFSVASTSIFSPEDSDEIVLTYATT